MLLFSKVYINTTLLYQHVPKYNFGYIMRMDGYFWLDWQKNWRSKRQIIRNHKICSFQWTLNNGYLKKNIWSCLLRRTGVPTSINNWGIVYLPSLSTLLPNSPDVCSFTRVHLHLIVEISNNGHKVLWYLVTSR